MDKITLNKEFKFFKKYYKNKNDTLSKQNYIFLLQEIAPLKKQLSHLNKTLELHTPVDFFYTSFIQNNNDISAAAIISSAKNFTPSMSINELSLLCTAAKVSFIKNIYLSLKYNPSILEYSFSNLRKINSINFNDILEKLSPIDPFLNQDPSNSFAFMDFASKNYYRYLICQIAIKTKTSQVSVAKHILAKSKQLNRHIGFEIVKLSNFLSKQKKLSKTILISQLLLSVILSTALLVLSGSISLSILSLFLIFELLKTPTLSILSKVIKPALLPKIELQKFDLPIPNTAIVISTLVPNQSALPALKQKLIKTYLASSVYLKDSRHSHQIKVVLLADLKEADSQTLSTDLEKLLPLSDMIASLNKQFNHNFILLSRKRVFSTTQNSYIPHERKRGAICDFVKLSKTNTNPFNFTCGDLNKIKDLKFMLLLDEDSIIQKTTLLTLLSHAIHPLNRPLLKDNIVVSGYGVFSPKIVNNIKNHFSPTNPKSNSTIFEFLLKDSAGYSSYDFHTCELYQDGFMESIFCGKGLVNVSLFHSLICDKLPDEKILSHDIIEGSILKTAFISKCEIADNFPSKSHSFYSRLHRWIRGDLQNAHFIFNAKKYNLSKLSVLKLSDNIRRTITPILAYISLIILSLTAPKYSFLFALVCVLSLCFSSIYNFFTVLFTQGLKVFTARYFSAVLNPFSKSILSIFSQFIYLPALFTTSLDALVRSLFRTLFSHKKLLQWSTASDVEREKFSVKSLCLTTIKTSLIPIVLAFLSPYLAFKLLWIFFALSPLFQAIFDIKTTPKPLVLSKNQLNTITSYQLSMHSFFEKYVDKSHNFLPIDNLQTHPEIKTADRTSPTNIGLYLLSCVAAFIFKFISYEQLLSRISNTIATVDKLEKWKGNLYNWYDTKTLCVLPNNFVSSVDSGNFICCLHTLKQFLLFLPKPNSNLISQIQTIIDNTSLSPFYNPNLHLFNIGFDTQTNSLTPYHYDFLMSEARMLSYFSIATNQVPVEHWKALARTKSKLGCFSGAISWTGTAFEYFMPQLLLPCYKSSQLFENLLYSIHCQKKRGLSSSHKLFGISESCYYRFDEYNNYQYKAHGVQKLALKQGQNNEFVISPYSSFLFMPFDFNPSFKNLERLKSLNLFSDFGFYEAFDCTNSSKPIFSYMSHHIGMSMISLCNLLFDNIFQKAFMSDPAIASASHLLKEKIDVNHNDFLSP